MAITRSRSTMSRINTTALNKPKVSTKAPVQAKAPARIQMYGVAPEGYVPVSEAAVTLKRDKSAIRGAVMAGEIKACKAPKRAGAFGRKSTLWVSLSDARKRFQVATGAHPMAAFLKPATPEVAQPTAQVIPQPEIRAMGSSLGFLTWVQQGLRQKFLTPEEGARFLAHDDA